MRVFADDSHFIEIANDDVLDLYDHWASPVVIVSDGPYGVKGFKGDLPSYEGLADWYEPHITKWSVRSTPQTTLWFWNTEIGWATVHPVLEKYGWEYRVCNIWDKGIAHVAGNANTKSLRKLPVVTEVCVQYIKKATFQVDGQAASMRDWLRHEWIRSGLPLSKTNEAAGVTNAATRKYFTKDHLWYFPPPEAFEGLTEYANSRGRPEGRPYFSVDGIRPISKDEWSRYRAKFDCPVGITNVWSEPPLNGSERLKNGLKSLHLNQKPVKLMELTIGISSDPSDLVWEPFGGLCSAAVACHNLNRSCLSAEVDGRVYKYATERLIAHVAAVRLAL